VPTSISRLLTACPFFKLATACPRSDTGSGYIEVMLGRFDRDPPTRRCIGACPAREPLLDRVRIEIVDTFVRTRRVTRQLAEGMVELIGIVPSSAATGSE
jgi:hypothetical protein